FKIKKKKHSGSFGLFYRFGKKVGRNHAPPFNGRGLNSEKKGQETSNTKVFVHVSFGRNFGDIFCDKK
ncbi:hypothetical protein, partial [Streptococcus pluranimalium]